VVNEEDSVQVVYLVLNTKSDQLLGLTLKFISVTVEGGDSDGAVPFN
jgi:hypothetical protein